MAGERKSTVKGEEVIGRMYRNPELHALRLLLLHLTGGDVILHTKPDLHGEIWERLRWVRHQECASLQEAAKLSGLLRSHGEVEFILEEMLATQASTSLVADAFALLLVCHDVGDAREIWQNSWKEIGHVFSKDGHSDIKVHNLTLDLIDNTLNTFSLNV